MSQKIKDFENRITQILNSTILKDKNSVLIANNNRNLDIHSYNQILITIEDLTEQIISSAYNYKMRINYLSHFENKFEELYATYITSPLHEKFIIGDIFAAKKYIPLMEKRLKDWRERLEFDLDFFHKLGFLDCNVVAVGSNGSGKTSLTNKLKWHIKEYSVIISAQRILSFQDIDSIDSPKTIKFELKKIQTTGKENKNPKDINILQKEFSLVLKSLLADNYMQSIKYRAEALETWKKSEHIKAPLKNNLDKTLEIWNSLIENRYLQCDNGINISVKDDFGRKYSVAQMSDGEKTILFLTAQVLQAPENGFVIIDEPEMFLHKSILNKLWDCLEKERDDCIFVYLTHDLDFAVSRTDAKKMWIKSYSPRDNTWEIEDIPINSIPESLILELVGSKKNILFCEGKEDNKDEKIYNILFPSLTIKPVESCHDVINYTKSFNRIKSINTSAIGLIDLDRQPPERVQALASDNIYCLSVAEVENLLLDEKFLISLSKKILSTEEEVEKIKNKVIEELNTCKEMQAANHASSKVNYYFKDSNVSQGNSLEDLEKNLRIFNDNINISEWYQQRISDIEDIVNQQDYFRAIKIFNHKGLKKFANEQFKIRNFTDRAIAHLQKNEKDHDFYPVTHLVKKYFPDELANYTKSDHNPELEN